jgi:hypothetical protein
VRDDINFFREAGQVVAHQTSPEMNNPGP